MPDSTLTFAPLDTERFLLRPLRAADAAELHRLVNDWEVAKTLARMRPTWPGRLTEGRNTSVEAGASSQVSTAPSVGREVPGV